MRACAYHDGSRALQDRFDTRRLADRIEEKFLARRVIDAEDRAFIERMDMFFLATADAEGRPQCSYKGGDPGFVRVLDEHTVAFPNYDGNGMYLSMGNLLANPQVGMLFIDFVSARPSRLRLNGVASIDERDRAARPLPRGAVRRPRACHRGVPELPAVHPPDGAGRALAVRARARPRPPVPDWKRSDWACDVLPAGDPARGQPAARRARAAPEWRAVVIGRCRAAGGGHGQAPPDQRRDSGRARASDPLSPRTRPQRPGRARRTAETPLCRWRPAPGRGDPGT